MIPPLAGDAGSRHNRKEKETPFAKEWLTKNDIDNLRAEFDAWKWEQENRIESLEKHIDVLIIQVRALVRQTQGKDSE